MALARRTPWRGLQAVAVAAERLQLVLAPSICSQLQLSSALSQVACGNSPGQVWSAAAPWWAAACTAAAAAPGGWPAAGHVRWHGSKPHTPADSAAAEKEKQAPAAPSSLAEAFSRAGWSRQEVFNVPNGLSMLRLLSGPVIAAWIVQGQWHLALPTLAVSGATDWADGYVAKNFNQRSVLGSYLDPLADKTLMCSVIAAMGYTGALSGPMVALILGRDVFLVAGAFAARAQMLGWRWPGAGEFFRLSPSASSSSSGSSSSSRSSSNGSAAGAPQHGGQQDLAGSSGSSSRGGGENEGAPSEAPAAPFVEPLYISKVNTCFQLGLAGAAMARAWLGWPGEEVVWWAAAGTGVTTVWSCAAYVRAYMAGNLLTAGKKATA